VREPVEMEDRLGVRMLDALAFGHYIIYFFYIACMSRCKLLFNKGIKARWIPVTAPKNTLYIMYAVPTIRAIPLATM
jgi:hypothetical protein